MLIVKIFYVYLQSITKLNKIDVMTDNSKQTSVQISEPDYSLHITRGDIDDIVKASAVTGVTSKGEWLMSVQKAKELGIGPGNALTHMHTVNGKTGIDIHIIKALLSRTSSGITWKLINDYTPIYATYSDGSTSYTYDTLPLNYIILNKLSGNPKVNELINEGKVPVAILPTVQIVNKKQVTSLVPIDYITTYEFTRIRKNIKGEWETIEVTSSFKWSEALTAKLPLDSTGNYNEKSVWSKYPKLMLGIRAFTYGAREIASDILLGVYETSELYNITDTPHTVDSEGTVTIIEPIQ